jgi:hypothetical protein
LVAVVQLALELEPALKREEVLIEALLVHPMT